MKHPIRNLAFFVIFSFALALPQPVFAQDIVVQPSFQTPVDLLKDRCDSIVPVIRRLHKNDALLRVNIGQVYTSISTRLMSRLNSRLVLNRIDSSRLISITNQFESSRQTFRDNYNNYESVISDLIKIDCKSQPTEFYAKLLVARDSRSKLAGSTKQLNNLVSEYRVNVERLCQAMEMKERENNAN